MNHKKKSTILPSGLPLEILQARAQGARQPVSILFVHGGYHAAWSFEHWLKYFAERGFDSYAVSVRGHGASPGRENIARASMNDYLADLREALTRIQGPVILVGHSMGGMLIQKHIETQSVAGAVLIATSTDSDIRAAGLRLLFKYPWSALKYLLSGNANHLFHRRDVCRDLFFAGLNNENVERALDHLVAQSESPRAIREMSFMKFAKPVSGTPILFVGGGRDESIPQSSLEIRAKAYGGICKFYEDRPHELAIVDGWQDVASDIHDWIQQACAKAA